MCSRLLETELSLNHGEELGLLGTMVFPVADKLSAGPIAQIGPESVLTHPMSWQLGPAHLCILTLPSALYEKQLIPRASTPADTELGLGWGKCHGSEKQAAQ